MNNSKKSIIFAVISCLPSRLSLLMLTAIMPLSAISTEATPAHAEFTIATVDVNRVLNESEEAKAKRKELDDHSNKAREKIEAKKKALQATEKKLKEGDIKEDSSEAEKFRSDARDFARFVKDAETDIKGEFMKYNRTLTDKTMKLIEQYAKNNNIDLVLDKSNVVRGPVLFGNDTADITDAIIVQVNQ